MAVDSLPLAEASTSGVPEDGRQPERTDERYCRYDKPHGDYVYSPAYVQHLIKRLSTAEGFGALVGMEPDQQHAFLETRASWARRIVCRPVSGAASAPGESFSRNSAVLRRNLTPSDASTVQRLIRRQAAQLVPVGALFGAVHAAPALW